MGMGIIIMYQMMVFSGVLSVNKIRNRDQRYDLLFDTVRGIVGPPIVRPYDVPSRVLRTFGQLTFRFVHPDGRSVDLTFDEADGYTFLKTTETEDTGLVVGLRVRIEDLARLADLVPLQLAASVGGRYVTTRLRTQSQKKALFSAAKDWPAIRSALPALGYLTARAMEGLFCWCIRSLKPRRKK